LIAAFGRCECCLTDVPAFVECIETVSFESIVASVIRFGSGFEDEDIFDGNSVNVADSSELPVRNREISDVFSEEKADILPEHRIFDWEIDLKLPGLVPPFRPIYIYLKWIVLNSGNKLMKCWQKVLFTHQKHQQVLEFSLFRREITNELTVRNSFPLLLILDLIHRLRFARVFYEG
jgi:hypothetical protein